MGSIKKINVKNHIYYFCKDVIDIKKFNLDISYKL